MGKNASGIGNDLSRGVSADTSGNVYITGAFLSSSIAFGATILTNDGCPSGTCPDIFLSKSNSSGDEIWARKVSGTSDEDYSRVIVQPDGNIYMTGHFYDSTIVLGSFELTKSGKIGNDIFIANYDSSGNVLWAKNIGGKGRGSEEINSLMSDVNGNLYVTGYFSSSSIAFSMDTLVNKGYIDLFVSKLGNNSTGMVKENNLTRGVNVFPNPSRGVF